MKSFGSIVNFAEETFDYAYTHGPLKDHRKSESDFANFVSGFLPWINEFFQSMLEENYYTLNNLGVVSHPVEDYYIVFIGSFMAVCMPFWIPLYVYWCYTTI